MTKTTARITQLVALGCFGIALLPVAAFAAYNDVTLTTDAVIQVGSYTLNVSGSSATIQSITVNPTNFSITLASGSSAKISSPTLQQLSSDVTSDVTNTTCTGSGSSLTLAYSGAGTVTNTITPSATVCSGSGSSVSVSSSGGGGGGGGGTVSPSVLATILAPSASTTAYLNSLQNPVVPNCGDSCTPTQHVALAINNVTIDLSLGSQGPDVKTLQQFLNTHGFTIAASGAGSPGNESDYFGTLTQAALIKFQLAQDIHPAAGYFGPITRAAILTLTKTAEPAIVSTASSTPVTFATDLAEGSQDHEVVMLQQYLNAHGYTVASTGPGSPGNETDYFGSLTKAALAKFQADHGISPAAGYFGPITRAYIAHQ
jgi:peptidoglycan hydrolase-like protein with peptidoglycan-binding domain